VIARLQILFEYDVFGDEPPPLDRVAQHDDDFVVFERLGNVIERAFLHRGDRVLHRCEGRDHHDRKFFVLLVQLLEDLQPVNPRHHHVDDDGVKRKRTR
jgi:hypothetical protein